MCLGSLKEHIFLCLSMVLHKKAVHEASFNPCSSSNFSVELVIKRAAGKIKMAPSSIGLWRYKG